MKTFQPIFFVVFTIFILCITLSSEAERQSPYVVSLEEIQIIAGITVDLPLETTAVFVKNECVCACRDGTWSCTNLKCKKQDDACINLEIDDLEITQRPTQGYQPYSMITADDVEQ